MGLVLGWWTIDALDTETLPSFYEHAHVDLRPADQGALVQRALELAASRAEIGQGESSWVVLADPEGNEFCILSSADEEAREREVARALELGATEADIGQGEVSWSVMADPDGNEFCILNPPPADPTAG